MPELIKQVNQRFAAFYQQVDFTADPKSQGLQAVAVVYSRYYNQLWQVGDAQINLDGQLLTNPKPSDLVLSDMRSLILRLSPNSNQQADPGRKAILPWILKATQLLIQTTVSGAIVFLMASPSRNTVESLSVNDDPPDRFSQ